MSTSSRSGSGPCFFVLAKGAKVFQQVVDGKVQVKSPGQSEGYEFALSTIGKTGAFDIDVGTINKKSFPDGIEFKLNYWTNAQKNFGGAGLISWE